MNRTSCSSTLRLLAGLVFGFASTLAQALFGPDCPSHDQRSAPAWVAAGYQYQQEGWRYGFGEARYRKGEHYEEQLGRAESAAQTELLQSLPLTLTTELSVHTTETSRGRSVDYQQDVSRQITSSSHLLLPGMPIKDTWQDPELCNLYVLVELSDQQLHWLREKTRAHEYFLQANNPHHGYQERMTAIDGALSSIQQWLADDSPENKPLVRKYQRIKHALQRQLDARRNLVLFVDNQPLNDQIFSDIAAQISGSFRGGLCHSQSECWALAQDSQARHITIINSNLEREQGREFHLGHYQLNLTIWDMGRQQKIYTSAQDTTFKAAKFMRRQAHELTLTQGYQKWLRSNPQLFASLASYYH